MANVKQEQKSRVCQLALSATETLGVLLFAFLTLSVTPKQRAYAGPQQQQQEEQQVPIEVRPRQDGRLTLIDNRTGNTTVVDNPNKDGKLVGVLPQRDGKLMFIYEEGDPVRIDNPFAGSEATKAEKEASLGDSADQANKAAAKPFENSDKKKDEAPAVVFAGTPKPSKKYVPLPENNQTDKKEEGEEKPEKPNAQEKGQDNPGGGAAAPSEGPSFGDKLLNGLKNVGIAALAGGVVGALVGTAVGFGIHGLSWNVLTTVAIGAGIGAGILAAIALVVILPNLLK